MVGIYQFWHEIHNRLLYDSMKEQMDAAGMWNVNHKKIQREGLSGILGSIGNLAIVGGAMGLLGYWAVGLFQDEV